ncbi:MAG: HAMP domain-containing histidine kinase, partial [Chloroflexi bacterium]|nr:HAMP domain-containing histidine kinase [Chloroflexota bacterium]
VPADAAELEKARAAAAGLSGIVAQLGELTQAEAAPLQRSPQHVAMADLAREIVASLDGLLRDRGVTATVEPGPEGADAHVDRGQVSRALRNLVTNAIQHSAPAGSVRIGVSRASGVEVRVADDGPGIADEDMPYIFERFYRADRSRGRMPGSGIGLTVARELIVANGGTVEVESTGPAGTTFRVTLPAAD